jgi:excisionase family DNA binding protein
LKIDSEKKSKYSEKKGNSQVKSYNTLSGVIMSNFINSYPQSITVCSSGELHDQIRQVVRDELSEFSDLLANQVQAKSNSEEKLLTRNQLAEKLGISLPTIWKKMRDGDLPYKRFGKKIFFSERDINNYLEEGGKL